MNIFPPYSAKVWRAIVYVAIGLLLLAVVLFVFDKCGSYWSSRDIKKAQENVNIAMNAVNAAKGTVSNDRVAEAVALEQLKEATNDVVNASTATDEAKAEANAALANYIAQKASNKPTGTTEADLQKKLEALGQ